MRDGVATAAESPHQRRRGSKDDALDHIGPLSSDGF
jgi:hypothetical protein